MSGGKHSPDNQYEPRQHFQLMERKVVFSCDQQPMITQAFEKFASAAGVEKMFDEASLSSISRPPDLQLVVAHVQPLQR